MSSHSETGHAKNVANFGDLISFLTGYGATYNPSKNSLKISALTAQKTSADLALNAVIAKNTAYNVAVNTRMDAFKGLRALSTRLVNALQATDASDHMISNAKSLNRKIQGQRASKLNTPTDPTSPVPNTISTSQQSYDQLIQHLSALIELLQAEPTYAPNENDLKTASLITYRNNLILKNQVVVDAYTDVTNARIGRNTVLYASSTGLVPIALDVKKYVKSIFNASSPQYREVSGIEFRMLNK